MFVFIGSSLSQSPNMVVYATCTPLYLFEKKIFSLKNMVSILTGMQYHLLEDHNLMKILFQYFNVLIFKIEHFGQIYRICMKILYYWNRLEKKLTSTFLRCIWKIKDLNDILYSYMKYIFYKIKVYKWWYELCKF